MRKLFNEFFYIPKHGKIREKVMLTRLAMTITIVIVCLAAMSITAYSYFSYNITSSFNTIKAAFFEADVSIHITNEIGEEVTIIEETNHIKTADLLADNTYHIVLDESLYSTAKTGFCIITAAGSDKIYHTQQLGADATVEGGKTDKITFELCVTSNTTVSFVSHWGTSSHYAEFSEKGKAGDLYITNDNIGDKKIMIVINDVINSSSNTEETMTPTVESTEVIYEVKSGNTLWEIAKQYGTSVEALKTYNQLNSSIIRVGQKIKIPPVDWKLNEITTDQTLTSTPETITSSSTELFPSDEAVSSSVTESSEYTSSIKFDTTEALTSTERTELVDSEEDITTVETQPVEESADASIIEEN